MRYLLGWIIGVAMTSYWLNFEWDKLKEEKDSCRNSYDTYVILTEADLINKENKLTECKDKLRRAHE